MRGRVAILVVVAAQAQEIPPVDPLLAKISSNAIENQRVLPNYTCSETIERFEKPGKNKPFERMDIVRLEVAYVEGKELFGWPGSSSLREPEMSKLVSGATGNGDFGLLPKVIFVKRSAAIGAAAVTEHQGKVAWRYDYRVAADKHAFRVTGPIGSADVGFHGSFWVDAATLDVLRIEGLADDIRADTGLLSVDLVVDYARTAIGRSTFLLPVGSERTIIGLHDITHRNVTRFSDCRQFVGESVLTFGDPLPAPGSVIAPPPRTDANLPNDFVVGVRIETPIDSQSSAVGDIVKAVLRSPVMDHHEAVLPKGARLMARVARLERLASSVALELKFTDIEFEGGHASLEGRENRAMLHQTYFAKEFHSASAMTRFWPQILTFRGKRFVLGSGTDLMFRSRLLKSEEHDPIHR